MKILYLPLSALLLLVLPARAATLNWSATVDHGFSLVDGTELPVGSLVRLGYFRDSVSGTQLTDAQIQALQEDPTALDTQFVEVATTTLGTGYSPAIAGHFAQSSTVDTSSAGKNVAGKQMYLWVFSNSSTGTSSQQAILYWSISDTTTNPDGSADAPGTRWAFPAQSPPEVTTIDLTDLTTGSSALSAGAHVVVGKFSTGTSSSTGAPNFALANIISIPSVTTGTQLVGGIVGTTYSQTLSAINGTPPYEWDVTSGSLPDGLTLSAAGVLSGTPTSAGSYPFTVRVMDDAGKLSTKAITLVIADSALIITTISPLGNGQEGALYSQALTASGGTAPYTWSLISGSLPTGVTFSNGAFSGTPVESGTFSLAVKVMDAGLLTATQNLSLTITPSSLAITTTSLLSAVVNYAYAESLTVSGGNSSSYTWALTTGTLPAGLSLSTPGIISGTPTSASAATPLTFRVMDAAGVTRTQALTLSVQAKLPLPAVNAPGFPTTMVSAIFSHTLSATYAPKKFTVTGLPSGLSYVGTTGVISGRPKVSGVYNVRISASNATGTSPLITAKLTVLALPTTAVGTFMGHIASDTAVTGNRGGRFDLTTTSTGSYTAKATIGGVVKSVTGTLTTAVGTSPQVIGSISRGSILPPWNLVLTLGSNIATGTLSVMDGLVTSNTDISAWRSTWNASTNPATSYAGYYTAALDPSHDSDSDITGSDIPQGTGYLSFTVSAAGTLTVSGRASDGSALATTGFIGPSGQMLLHQSLYSNLGALTGHLTLQADAGGDFSGNSVSGQLDWFKPAVTSRTYSAGFNGLILDVVGRYLAPASKGYIVLGLPDTGAFDLDFDAGGIESSSIVADVDAGTFTDALKVSLPAVGSLDNPGKVTLSINTATGVVSGTFTLVDGTLPRKVTYYGMIVRGGTGTSRAFGYFLLPQIPTSDQTSSTSPILSGQVSIFD